MRAFAYRYPTGVLEAYELLKHLQGRNRGMASSTSLTAQVQSLEPKETELGGHTCDPSPPTVRWKEDGGITWKLACSLAETKDPASKKRYKKRTDSLCLLHVYLNICMPIYT